MKDVYISSEDLHYGLSVLTGDEEIGANSYYFRLNAFADLIENYVLSENIYFEDFGEFHDKGQEINSIIQRNHLHENIIQMESVNLPFKKHAPNLIGALKMDEVLNITDENELIIIDKLEKEWSQLTNSILPDISKSMLTQKYFELLDFMKFFIIEFAKPYEHEEETWEVFQSLIIESKKRNENFEIKDGTSVFDLFSMWYIGVTESTIISSVHSNLLNLPSPLKSSFMLNTPLFAPSTKVFLNKFGSAKYEESKKINDFLYNKYTKVIQMPLLFNYIVSKSSNIKEVFEISTSLKKSKEVRAYRKHCVELDNLLIQGKQSETIKLINEVESLILGIQNKYKVGKENKKITVQISFPPAISFDFSLSDRNKKYLAFLKKVYTDSLSPYILKEKINGIMKNASNIV